MPVDVHEWFEMQWADVTNQRPVGIDMTPIKFSPPWVDVLLGVDWLTKRFRWHGWVCTPTGMKRVCEMTRLRAVKKVEELCQPSS